MGHPLSLPQVWLSMKCSVPQTVTQGTDFNGLFTYAFNILFKSKEIVFLLQISLKNLNFRKHSITIYIPLLFFFPQSFTKKAWNLGLIFSLPYLWTPVQESWETLVHYLHQWKQSTFAESHPQQWHVRTLRKVGYWKHVPWRWNRPWPHSWIVTKSLLHPHREEPSRRGWTLTLSPPGFQDCSRLHTLSMICSSSASKPGGMKAFSAKKLLGTHRHVLCLWGWAIPVRRSWSAS